MRTAFYNGIILSGKEDMEPVSGKVIVTDGEIISEILDYIPEDCSKFDLKGKYIMPGLINMHLHIPGSGKPKKKPTDTKKLVKIITSSNATRKIAESLYKNYSKTALMSGVTTIRTVGGVDRYDTWMRDRIAEGKYTGPRILASNMAVSVPGGHMAGSLAYEATTPDEAAAFVRKIAEDKPDLIKLMITGGVLDAKKLGEPGELKMKPELVKAACDEAHRLGLPVAAHVESAEGVKVALANGVDTIEHGAEPDDEIMELFKSRKAALTCTITPAVPYALMPIEVSYCREDDKFNGNVVFQGLISAARRCLAEGVPVGLGNDTGCPFVTHYCFWRELHYFAKYCGVSNAFALYSATLGNAKIAKIDGITGSIEAGKSADMIVTEKNPLENLEALRKVDAVVSRGKVYNNPVVKYMAKVDEEMDKYL